jgi:hypothetical protein
VFSEEIVSRHVTTEKWRDGSFVPWTELFDVGDIAGIELIQEWVVDVMEEKERNREEKATKEFPMTKVPR